jgi:hypothetical protein
MHSTRSASLLIVLDTVLLYFELGSSFGLGAHVTKNSTKKAGYHPATGTHLSPNSLEHFSLKRSEKCF